MRGYIQLEPYFGEQQQRTSVCRNEYTDMLMKLLGPAFTFANDLHFQRRPIHFAQE